MNSLRSTWSRFSRDELSYHVIRGVFGSFGVQALGLVFSLGSGVLLARALRPIGYGYYAYALAWLELLKVPVAYGHPLLIQREVAIWSAESQWPLVRGLLRRTSQGVVVIALCLILLVGGITFLRRAGAQPIEQIGAFRVALLMLPLLGLSAIRSGALNGLHRVSQSLLADNVVRPLLSTAIVAAIWLGARTPMGPTLAMTIQLGALLVAFIFGQWLLGRALPRSMRREPPVYRTREWLSAVWPFMLTGGAFAVWGTIGIIALGWFRPAAEVGVYRTATLIAGLALLPINAFSFTVSPSFARLYAAGETRRLQNVVTYTTLAVFGISVAGLIFFVAAGRQLLGLAFGPPYVSGYPALVTLAAGYLCYATIWSVLNILDMSGHQRYSLLSLLTAAVINLMLAPLLIPRWGMTGAAFATTASWFIGHLWLVPVVRAKVGVRATLFDALADWRSLRADS